MNKLVVYKNRTNIITVRLGYDITGDTLTSQIREQPDQDAAFIAEWDVDVVDAALGEITMTLTPTDLVGVTQVRGFTDIKRVSSGQSLPVFTDAIQVEFRGTVTA